MLPSFVLPLTRVTAAGEMMGVRMTRVESRLGRARDAAHSGFLSQDSVGSVRSTTSPLQPPRNPIADL